MRHSIIALLLSVASVSASNVFGNELQNAYQKEYAYLIAEKKALTARLASLKTANTSSLSKIEVAIETLLLLSHVERV